ncbi:hypothetical protein [Yoonia sp.]|uniref:hypothetical protein n=1 Tax=Yoonia sp. TaxID=2212373 RepID=UPI0035C7AF27
MTSKVYSTARDTEGSLEIRKVGGKFIIEERSNEEALRLFVETALCIVVGIVFLGSFLLFIRPEIQFVRNYSGISLSAVMATLAILLYIYATRGTRPQAGFDRVKQQFWTCKINAKGHARIVTYYAKSNIQGIFIRRPGAASKDAALCARIKGKLMPIILIHGTLTDVESAHRELCDALHNADIVLPAKPSLKSPMRRARPKQGARVS